jgi:hypothetical protein
MVDANAAADRHAPRATKRRQRAPVLQPATVSEKLLPASGNSPSRQAVELQKPRSFLVLLVNHGPACKKVAGKGVVLIKTVSAMGGELFVRLTPNA